jgi:hypothetical protein
MPLDCRSVLRWIVQVFNRDIIPTGRQLANFVKALRIKKLA